MSVRQDEELKLWFKTPFKTSVRQVLKGQASNSFRTKVQSTFGLTDSELELVLPKSDKVTCEKTSTDVQLYFTDPTQPLFFEPNKGRGSLYPTLFAVWKYPNLVPRVYAYSTPVQHIVTSQLQSMYRVAQWIPMLPDAFFTRKLSNSARPADLMFVPKESDANKEQLQTKSLAASLGFSEADTDLKSWTALSGNGKPQQESKSNSHGELDVSTGGLGSRAFDFDFAPNQIRALYVVGEPHAVAIGVTQCKLSDLLAFGQAATKLFANSNPEEAEEDFAPFPWPTNPWPSTWPPESLLSDDEEKVKGVFKAAASAGLNSAASIVDRNRLLESRMVGKGECISLVNVLGDQLTLSSPTRIPKCFTLVPTTKAAGMNAVLVKTDTYKPEWAKLLMALRLSWLGCLVPQTSLNEKETSESCADAEIDTELPASRNVGEVSSACSDDESNEEKYFKNEKEEVESNLPEEVIETDQIGEEYSAASEFEPSLSPETMSQYIVNAFIVAAKTRIKDKMLPLDASGLMSNHLKFCAVRSLVQTSPDSQVDGEGQPPFVRLDLKKSTFKTLSKLITYLKENDVVTFKNVRSALHLTSINRKSDMLLNFTVTQKMQQEIREYEQFLRNESADLAAAAEAASSSANSDQLPLSALGKDLMLPVTAIRLTASQVEFLLQRPEAKYLREEGDEDDADADLNNQEGEQKQTDLQACARAEEALLRYLFLTRNLVLDSTLMKRAIRGYIQETRLLDKPLYGNAPPVVSIDSTLSKVLHGCKGQAFPVNELDDKLRRSLTTVTSILPNMIHTLSTSYGQKEMNASRKRLLYSWQSEERHRILATIKASTWSSRMSESCTIQSVRDKRGDFLTIITELEIFGPSLIEAFRSNSNLKKHLACNVEVKPLPPLLKNRLARNVDDKDVVILHGKLEEKVIDVLVNRIGLPKNCVKRI